MKKTISVLLAVAIFMFTFAPAAFAADEKLSYEIAYDAKQNYVTVTLYINDAEGLQSADLVLGFDPEMYEPIDNFAKADLPDDAMCIAGIPPQESGTVSCSVIFTEDCKKSDLDSDGRLKLGTFSFLPRVKEYDIDAFCYFALSFDVGDKSIKDSINYCGNPVYMEGRTAQVTTPEKNNINNSVDTTKKGTAATDTKINSNWYVYLIAGVLAVAAIAGIAMVAIKSGHHDEQESEENGEKPENKKED